MRVPALDPLLIGIVIGAAFMTCETSAGWTVTAGTIYHEISQEIADFLLAAPADATPDARARSQMTITARSRGKGGKAAASATANGADGEGACL